MIPFVLYGPILFVTRKMDHIITIATFNYIFPVTGMKNIMSTVTVHIIMSAIPINNVIAITALNDV